MEFDSVIKKMAHEKFNESVIHIYDINDTLAVLDIIYVPIPQRNKGIGRKIMENVCSLADEYGITLNLTVSDIFGSDVKNLVKFYNSFNFRLVSGYDMKRLPLTQ